MIHEQPLPKLAKRMLRATFAVWLVEPGERVRAGQPICDVTTDKVTLEIDAITDGVVRHCFAAPGDLVPVSQTIALLTDTEDEPIPQELLDAAPKFAPAPPVSVSCDITPDLGDKLVSLNDMRAVIAQRMSIARHTMPHFYLTTDVDMTAAVEMRQTYKKKRLRFSYNDMLLKACGLSLRKYPQVASLYTPSGYVQRSRMHVGFAVATEPEGLVVPVIRDVDQKSLQEVSEEAKELARKARNKRLTQDDYGFGVFTLSNLGSYEVEQFTAIINPVNAAILATGKVIETVAAVHGEIRIIPQLKMTISSDHRVIDGVLAARFNGHLKYLMEHPQELL